MAKQQLIDNETGRFPADIAYVPFVQHSESSTSAKGSKDQRMIICGGSFEHECQFYEIFRNHIDNNYEYDDNTDITFVSFSSEYKCKNSNLRAIGIKNGEHTYSLMTRNGKFLIIICEYDGYNVYDMDKDLWLLENNYLKLRINPESRVLFINDKMLLVSQSNHITFHNLTDKLNPIQIHGYAITNVNAKHYSNHGFCLISIKPAKTLMSNNSNNKRNQSGMSPSKNKKQKSNYYLISILLFGGKNEINFRQSFINLQITVSKDFTRVWEIVENAVSSKDISYVNSNDNNKNEKNLKIGGNLRFFGYQCLKNMFNETVIVIIGGMCYNKKKTNDEFEFEKSIILFNFQRQQIYIEKNVLPIACRSDPATMLGIGNADNDDNLCTYYESLFDSELVIQLNVPIILLKSIVSFLDGNIKICHVVQHKRYFEVKLEPLIDDVWRNDLIIGAQAPKYKSKLEPKIQLKRNGSSDMNRENLDKKFLGPQQKFKKGASFG